MTSLLRRLVIIVFALLAALPAHALTAVDGGIDIERVDVVPLGQVMEPRGDAVQIETATAADGTSGRMSVRAATNGTSPSWFVFALKNPTDKPLERWLVADRYQHAGSGIIWPKLDSRRIEAVTPSLGYVPERLPFDSADAFRLTVEPGQTVTFVAELSGDYLPRLQLWRGLDYEKRSRNRQLFHGILLGIVGLLAVFLTTIFGANHKAIFPSAALFTWCVLAYLCVDFGFWHKLFNVRPEESAQYRAATEAGMSASLLIFAHTFLRIGRWHGLIRVVVGLMMAATLALVGLAFLDPKLSATFARLSFAGVLALSALVTTYLALRGQDRALAIIPAWILFGVWVFGAALVLSGRLQSDVVVNGMMTGLVLLVMLIGFTVTQFAFRAIDPLFGASPDDQQLRSQAIDGTGAALFEWNAKRDEIRVGPMVEAALGQKPVERREPTPEFVERMHPADRERLMQVLGGLKDRGNGTMRIEFRLRHADSSYRWFELDGTGIATPDRRLARCIGLIRETTDAKRAQERLLHDAVHDSLTSLPNRGLFLDRLSVAVARAKSEPLIRPVVFYIDLDRFKSVNSSFGLVMGDSLLITVARRLARLVGPSDTLGRVGGDQFAIVMAQARDEREQGQIAEEIRSAVKGVINIAGQEIVLTGSIGIAELSGGQTATAHDLLSDAEVAMYRARRGGADRIARFTAPMRADKDDRIAIESDLRAAIEKRQLKVLYQPIMYLRTETLAGFEALVRWEHPRLGLLNPAEFVPLAEESDLIVRLGSYVMQTAVVEAQRWNKEFPRPEAPLFVSVNVSSRQLFRQDLVAEVRHITSRGVLPKGALRLEVTESLVMENPEQATEILKELINAGARLSLDDFGAGYSSLSYLSAFPFDTIKVDRALVHMSSQSGAGSAVLRSVVALSHELGKTVVAEGVETDDDVGLLRSIGCDHAQGYIYGEPASAKETMAYVRLARKAEKKLKRGGLFRLRTRRIEDEAVAGDAPVPSTTAAAPEAADVNGAKPAKGQRRTSLRPRGAQPQQQPLAAANAQPPQAMTPPPQAQPRPQSPMPNILPQPAVRPLPVQPPNPTTQPIAHGNAYAALASKANGASPPMPPRPQQQPAPAAADRSLARLQAEITRTTAVRAEGAAGSEKPIPLQPAPPPGQSPAQPAAPPTIQLTTAPPASTPPPLPPAEPSLAPAATPVAAAVPARPATIPARAPPNLATLPPAIAASLARLAGVKAPEAAEPTAAPPASGTGGS